MRASSPVVSLALLAAAVAACAPRQVAPPRPDENAIRTAITAQLAKVGPIMLAKDTAGFANLFTADGTWILQDASTVTGRANLASAAGKVLASAQSLTAPEIAIDRLIVVNDSEAVTFSHGVYSITMKGKRPESHLNPFADLWKKEADGVWRIAYEINADGPAPQTPPTH